VLLFINSLTKKKTREMDAPIRPPRFSGLKYTLVAGLALLTTDALFAQSTGQSDVDGLKAQMNQMQRQYEQRIEAMEAKMKTLESNSNSGSILNTRVLTDANGTEAAGKAPAPMLDESFLKSLTRNFTFNVYMRAGVSFNGSGGAQGNTTFTMPDNYIGGGRSTSRLGNENDFFTELSWNQAHILGDSPDLADVSFRATFEAFSSPQKRSALTTTGQPGFGVGMEEGYVEMKNVIKSAPEITFWGGQRFYDRYNIDSEDYFWLNTSGFGVGAYNIHLGPGNLYLAWIGSNNDNLNEATGFNGANGLNAFNNNSTVGNLYKQTFDIRYKDIDIGFGKLSLVLIGNYIKGDTYQSTFSTFVRNPDTGVVTTSTNTTGVVRTQDMYGIGGGAIWEYDFGNKSMLRISGLYGYGATDFAGNIDNQLAAVNNAWQNQFNRFANGLSNNVQVLNNRSGGAPFTGAGTPFVSVNPVNRNTEALATAYFVWNPNPCFSLGVWANWEYNDNGTQALGFDRNDNLKIASGSRNIVSAGIRPVFWIADNIAIQGVAAGSYIDNVRYGSSNGGNNISFGRSGQEGIFTIAPTIKPKGGFFTRPEIRLFATYAIWSNSLKGTNASGGGVPPYNGNTNQGWLIGSQMEIWF